MNLYKVSFIFIMLLLINIFVVHSSFAQSLPNFEGFDSSPQEFSNPSYGYVFEKISTTLNTLLGIIFSVLSTMTFTLSESKSVSYIISNIFLNLFFLFTVLFIVLRSPEPTEIKEKELIEFTKDTKDTVISGQVSIYDLKQDL